MTLTGESFASSLTKCTPQWFALRQKEVNALTYCFDKECELSSAGRTHDSLECTQGFLNPRHLMRMLLKTRYAWI
jgi:hypothetical protein